LFQLGDGDVLVARADGSVVAAIPTDPTLVGGETTSLCLPNAATLMRRAELDLVRDPIVFLMVASDGYGNAFADANWRVAVGRDFATHLADNGIAWIGDHLEEWISESADVGGDDVTVGLIVPREIPSAAAFAAMPTATLAAHATTFDDTEESPAARTQQFAATPGETPATNGGRRRMILASAIAVLVVVLLGGAAFAVFGGSGDETPGSDLAPVDVPTTLPALQTFGTTSTPAPSTTSPPPTTP
jgi:hypothetical protein